jgi:uncharacterized protein
MIYRFGGRNFFSFKDEFEVDFRVKPQALDRDIFLTDSRGQNVNRVLGIFGANASGKTRLLQVLSFIKWFITTSANQHPDDHKFLSNYHFRFSKKPDLKTEVFIEFGMDDEIYLYDLHFSRERVIYESLKTKKHRWINVFEKKWGKGSYAIKSNKISPLKLEVQQRQNASLIATSLMLENAFAKRLISFFDSHDGNLSISGRNANYDPNLRNINNTTLFYKENLEHLDWVNRRLNHFASGINKVSIEKVFFVKEQGEADDFFVAMAHHNNNEGDFKLPMWEESTGTQALFVMLRYLLPVLKVGGIAYIDEFEQGLHSHMIPVLVDLFYSSKHNPNGAQLIFSCHSDYMLQHLEKYQIQLVDKDTQGVSTTYRLNEIQGVRNVDNHYAKYHAGAYGGTPGF